HFARDCRAKGNQDNRRRYARYNGNKARDNGRRPTYQDDSKALVTIDGKDIDWSGHVEEDIQNYAMMAYSSSNSDSDNKESDLEDTPVNDRYAEGIHAVPPPMTGNYMPSGPDVEIEYSKFTYGLKQTLVDESDSKTSDYASYESDSSVETTTSMPTPTKVECFNCHKIGHFARDCRAKGNQDNRRRYARYNGNKARDNGRRPTYQDDSKALVTIDGKDIDWSGHVEEDIQNYAMMAYSSSNSDSDNKESDLEDTPVNDRYAEGIHAVPPLMTGNYMPSGPDVEIEYSKFTYGLKQTLVDESDSKPSDYASYESDSSVETTTSMPTPVKNAPKVICEPKVWNDAPIIEEYESDSDDDSVSNVQEDKETPSFAFTVSVQHVKPSRENVKETSTPSQCPKVKKQGRTGHTRKG
nr:hypothetical protein [Tanacetum cinerariifolium]